MWVIVCEDEDGDFVYESSVYYDKYEAEEDAEMLEIENDDWSCVVEEYPP